LVGRLLKPDLSFKGVVKSPICIVASVYQTLYTEIGQIGTFCKGLVSFVPEKPLRLVYGTFYLAIRR